MNAVSRRNFLGSAALLASAFAAFGLIGCDAQPEETPSSGEATQTPTEDGAAPQASGATLAGNSAVVYFSMPLTESPDLDASSGASVVVEDDGAMVGNVEYVAQYIAAQTGADLIRIVPQVDYPDTPDELIDYAMGEQDRNERPAIELTAEDGSSVDSLDGYATLFIGYPIWWYELPMCMYTFFETYDLSGKSVYPFVVHGGSGLSGTDDDIREMQPDASVSEDGLSISRSRVADTAEEDVASWLTELGLA